MIKLLILGPTGLLGSTLLKYFSNQSLFKCYGAIRKNLDSNKLKNIKNIKLHKIDYKNKNSIIKAFNDIKPNLIINCIGVVKQLTHKNQLSEIIRVNSFLPHYLAELVSQQKKVKLIQFSTDCVFLGLKGNYKEKRMTGLCLRNASKRGKKAFSQNNLVTFIKCLPSNLTSQSFSPPFNEVN